ncbi:hypothetical protein [Protobacilladnavirus chasesal]|uniref:Uncharacterized protein n=1 Tax=Protobacilladnavirus chasesal TaxID=3052703 RepID=Q2L6L6_9VIRU|nr:hypothetical protein [Protobacilladnavirus chasesal]BAE79195.1 hypothetical protein [Protobacilladnavirus chasesal]
MRAITPKSSYAPAVGVKNTMQGAVPLTQEEPSPMLSSSTVPVVLVRPRLPTIGTPVRVKPRKSAIIVETLTMAISGELADRPTMGKGLSTSRNLQAKRPLAD